LRPLPLVLLALVVTALAACGSDNSSSGATTSTARGATSAAPTGFPVSIKHAFGTTTIEQAPTRVVTWGWGSTDAVVALGATPVAMPFQDYGGDDQGVLPWVREALQRRGTPIPAVLPRTASPDIPFEAIKQAQPDLILAVYSGITDNDYKLLNQIAPTVAYPDQAWTTPWRDVISIVGQALGRQDRAKQVLAEIDAAVTGAAKAHPELAGKSVAMVWDTPDSFYVYKPADPRVQFVEQLGLKTAPAVNSLANGSETFFYALSKEQVSALDADLLVSFADDEAAATAFTTSAYGRTNGAVQRGNVASITGTALVAAVSPPTALSLPWGLDAYVTQLSKAVNAGATTATSR
jgi:iron complex transport system substrate-binding protein